MNLKMISLAVATPMVILFSACSQEPASFGGLDPVAPDSDDFQKQWFAGKAELSRYELKQARYGEIHDGHALMVFVTEPFRTDLQVKADNGDGPSTQVLKLNAIRKFNTGIYDYSLMTSVFAPIEQKEYPHALKVTSSSQEWCGHTWMQMNRENDGYKGQLRSYFEQESDQEFEIKTTWIEDELWTQIRINPDALPLGRIDMLPSTVDLRLRHLPGQSLVANATLTEDSDHKGQMLYQVTYEGLERILTIRFESAFPHIIQGWTETIRSGYGPAAKVLTTEANLTHQIKSDYWSKHDLKDLPLRSELGLQ